MYLRPDEVAKVLENTGFERDYVTDQAYGYRKGAHYVYVNREARMEQNRVGDPPGVEREKRAFRHANLPGAHQRAVSGISLDLSGDAPNLRYGIAHGFSSREALSRYLFSMFL